MIVGAQCLLPSPFLLVSEQMAGSSGVAISPRKGAAIAAELADIRDRGHFIIAVKNNRAPLAFIDEAGNLSGFEIDIAHRLAEEILGDRNAVKFVPVRNVDRLNSVLADEVDIAIAAITLTEMRRRIVDFSDPYYLDGAAFITSNTRSLQTIQGLRTGRIALLDRSSTVPHVRFILPGARLIGVSSYEEGRQLLNSGEVDAFAGDASVLAGWLRESENESNASRYRVLPELLSADPLAIAIPKGQQHNELKAAINRELRRWYTEGWLQERAAYWQLPAEAAQFVDLEPTPGSE